MASWHPMFVDHDPVTDTYAVGYGWKCCLITRWKLAAQAAASLLGVCYVGLRSFKRLQTFWAGE